MWISLTFHSVFFLRLYSAYHRNGRAACVASHLPLRKWQYNAVKHLQPILYTNEFGSNNAIGCGCRLSSTLRSPCTHKREIFNDLFVC